MRRRRRGTAAAGRRRGCGREDERAGGADAHVSIVADQRLTRPRPRSGGRAPRARRRRAPSRRRPRSRAPARPSSRRRSPRGSPGREASAAIASSSSEWPRSRAKASSRSTVSNTSGVSRSSWPCRRVPSRRRLAAPVLAGQQAAREREVGDEAEPELPAARQHVPLGLALEQAVLVLERDERGQTAPAPRSSRPRRAARRSSSSSDAAAPCPRGRARPSPRASPRAASPRPGGGSRGGRRGRCAGAGASPRRRGGRSRGGRARSSPSPMSIPNFVASTTRSRRPSSSSPRKRSLPPLFP